MQLSSRGFAKAAIDVLEAGLFDSPDDGHLWQARAILLRKAGRHEEALDNIERAQVLVPLSHSGRIVLADGLRTAGRTQLSFDVYRSIAADKKLTADHLAELHRGFVELKAWHDSVAVCRRALEMTPDDDAIWFALAESLIRLEQPYEIVASVLRRAIQLAPTTHRYRVALVLQMLGQRYFGEAYYELCRIPVDALEDHCCGCCLDALLRLVCDIGDEQRSTKLAAMLANHNAQKNPTFRTKSDE